MQKVQYLTLAALLLVSAAHAQTCPAGHSPVKHLATRVPTRQVVAPASKAVARPAAPAPKPAVAAALPVAPAARPATAPVPTYRPAATRPLGAGSAVFHKGSNVLNLSAGFGLTEAVSGNASSMPALAVSYMRGVAQAGPGTISVGGLAGYKAYRWDYGSDKATWNHFFVGARGAYHYNFNQPNLDVYAGVGLGIHTASYSASQGASSTSSGSQLELSGFTGVRYFFTPAIGGFAELGHDMSLLKVGLSAHF